MHIGGRSCVPCLREGQPEHLKPAVAWSCCCTRKGPVQSWPAPTRTALSLYRGLCYRQLVLPTLVQRRPWGAFLSVVARAAPSFSQPGLPQAESIRGSLLGSLFSSAQNCRQHCAFKEQEACSARACSCFGFVPVLVTLLSCSAPALLPFSGLQGCFHS